jgi:hypothetical protein
VTLHFLFHMITQRCKRSLYFQTFYRYFVKFAFDCTFHIVVIIIMINILFGIIIDTFAQLRDEKQTKDDDKRNVCYICNIDRNTVSTLSYLIIPYLVRQIFRWIREAHRERSQLVDLCLLYRPSAEQRLYRLHRY